MKGAERRQFGRRQTCVHATIVPRGRPAILCVMRDVSSMAPCWRSRIPSGCRAGFG